ncbi:GNAT family N-acetyltransferase [Halobacillus litoralis]|uniref:GNAT family N-acetyltransferase n=1 Tax=Halobacillus litoralis TaxID=45668 RepID=A0A845E230_9BACI|nr:GNAT family N-acetyltransferase [Halobacillus litoralis]MYL49797.1 GNAT family N-acetyltransferase [Halobacillus litoralis]
MELKISWEHQRKNKDKIDQQLYEYNLKHFPEDLRGRYEEVQLYVKDADEYVRGGLLGEICWNWLEIHTLMMDEEFRGSGHGTKLLMEAERIARKKECDFIKVDTLSFQALDFYKKHGYHEFGVLNHVGKEFKHYYLMKKL